MASLTANISFPWKTFIYTSFHERVALFSKVAPGSVRGWSSFGLFLYKLSNKKRTGLFLPLNFEIINIIISNVRNYNNNNLLFCTSKALINPKRVAIDIWRTLFPSSFFIFIFSNKQQSPVFNQNVNVAEKLEECQSGISQRIVDNNLEIPRNEVCSWKNTWLNNMGADPCLCLEPPPHYHWYWN